MRVPVIIVILLLGLLTGAATADVIIDIYFFRRLDPLDLRLAGERIEEHLSRKSDDALNPLGCWIVEQRHPVFTDENRTLLRISIDHHFRHVHQVATDLPLMLLINLVHPDLVIGLLGESALDITLHPVARLPGNHVKFANCISKHLGGNWRLGALFLRIRLIGDDHDPDT